jgi:hypothetical protein
MRVLIVVCLVLTPPLVALSDRLLEGLHVSAPNYALTSERSAHAPGIAQEAVLLRPDAEGAVEVR